MPPLSRREKIVVYLLLMIVNFIIPKDDDEYLAEIKKRLHHELQMSN